MFPPRKLIFLESFTHQTELQLGPVFYLQHRFKGSFGRWKVGCVLCGAHRRETLKRAVLLFSWSAETLNPKLLLMGLAEPCMAAATPLVCECVCARARMRSHFEALCVAVKVLESAVWVQYIGFVCDCWAAWGSPSKCVICLFILPLCATAQTSFNL